MSTCEQENQRNPLLDEVAMAEKLSKINHIIIVLSGKGGVGKSTVAVNLALSLTLRGLRTGLMDVDIHGPSVPKLLNLTDKRPEVKGDDIIPVTYESDLLKVMSMGFLLQGTEQAVIWRGPLKYSMIKDFIAHVQWGSLDYLVVDCPPGTGDEPLSVAQFLKGKAKAVIVTTPQQVATIDVEKCITFCKQLELPVVGVIENMSGFVCPHCGTTVDIFSKGGGKILAAQYGIPFLGSIPLDPDIARSGDEERPYVYYYSKSVAAKVFDDMVEKIVQSGKNEPAGIGKQTENKSSSDNSLQNTDKADSVSLSNKEVSMKFAVPTNEGKLCAHFGHCEAFALIDTDATGKVVSETYITPPPHEPGLLPPWLSQQGVNCIIAGGMGSRAKDLFAAQGVNVITGAQGEKPRAIVEDYLKGVLQTGANTCDH
jgi:Mrp family chromosome partitioning ATPase/predicted Fe-Mo cluster-binding NifX family protein